MQQPEPHELIDIDRTAIPAANSAQFSFRCKPVSLNEAYAPVRKGTHADLIMTWVAKNFKDEVYRSAIRQKKLYPFTTWDRKFSFWMIINSMHCKADSDNCHKLPQDAFVKAGVIPDDSHAIDTRQMYVDFTKTKVDPESRFVVFIRWGDPIPSVRIEKANAQTCLKYPD